MNLEDFVDTLEIAASKYLWKLRIPAKTDNAVKAGRDPALQSFFWKLDNATQRL